MSNGGDSMQEDRLEVKQFGTSSSRGQENTKINNLNGPCVARIIRKRLKLRTDRVAKIAVSALMMTVMGTGIKEWIYNMDHDNVQHAHEEPIDGRLVHNHDLNLEYFIQDYKALNPKATEEDVMNAIINGEFEEYKNHNGSITAVKELQEKQKYEVNFYNTTCEAFADEVIEKHFSGK